MNHEAAKAGDDAGGDRWLSAARGLLGCPFGRYLLAAAAGLLLAAAFLELGLAGLAWVAPALMLACAWGRRGMESFRIGYVAGLAHGLASLYWLLLIPVTGYPILGWLALSAYLALYPASWVFWVQRAARNDSSWAGRTAWALGGAAAWVALEMLQARLFSGFPWNLLGASQYRMLPLIQIASITGVYGVSLVIVWFSLSLHSAATAILRQPAARHGWLGEVILPLAALLALFVFGLGRLREPPSDTPTVSVTFIQPSIPQTMIWNERENDNRFRQLLDLTARALTNRTDLLLWPEAAVPRMIRYDEPTFQAITRLARSNDLWMIVGSDDAEPRVGGLHGEEADYFNSAFLINPAGDLAGRYHKRHLVIFGEYIPLVRWLPFVKWFTPITGGFTPGTEIASFELELRRPDWRTAENGGAPANAEAGAPVKTATLICFEDMFPHLVREYVAGDTDFLVNLTNDGWFGEGVEQWQHAAGAVFRAVENGRPLARCCNNGLTCWIDSRGRLRDVLRDPNGRIYGPGAMTAPIPVLASGEKRARTFYNEHGDWFGWVCVGLTLFSAVLLLRKSTKAASALL